MKSDIFRKVALERLSSPEQLDQMLTVTPARSWIALIGVLLLTGLTVTWGFQGSVSTSVFGQGVMVRSGGVQTVVASGSGVITGLNVKIGDRLKRDQVIAQIAQPSIAERIRATEDNIVELERVRATAGRVRGESVKLQLAAIKRQKENAQREIGQLRNQAKLVSEQIPVEAELLAKGLITRQQTYANKQKLVDLEGQIAGWNAQLNQLDAQQYTVESSPLEADIDVKSRISDLRRQGEGLRKELKLVSNVVSPYSGEVIELKVQQGATVAAGVPLLSLQSDVKNLEVLVYVPASKAKEVKPQMEAQISPTTVRREEYGFLRGTVTAVAGYPATPAALMRNFQNETLVQSLLAAGPVTELQVSLQADEKTVSGYKWSSPLGPPVTLSSGAFCVTQVITRQQQPVSLVIPMLREGLGLH